MRSVIQSTPALKHLFELTASPIKEDPRQVKPRTILKVQLLLVFIHLYGLYCRIGFDTEARGLVILISLGLNVELVL